MARRSCTFRQRDVTVAVKAAQKAGLEIARVIVDRDGRIVIETPRGQAETVPGKNEWDEAR